MVIQGRTRFGQLDPMASTQIGPPGHPLRADVMRVSLPGKTTLHKTALIQTSTMYVRGRV
eukprot:2260278-Pyramimonas_sp.AAC.1